ncbi:MAG: ABC transporter ATP-binding protein [Tenericutes bacterium HGW-Tenericutes-2]|jgi:branched-chain amino acid transport system ATP-binding protein|nr:MAG: ABC transporter ATP-binding protein [Tenericutes bacterium HGW-Tenericutes-3]PKK97828.1 MAG: ABC transporter ATP-binding protein [Tenericutes bacterium HGW-Tenericutes-2]PKL00592.1 MAG: ABC transporter ATP-binding protein [Tenericutes bacterium HGW-Tenericutes-1]
MSVILEVKDLIVDYGIIRAIKGINLTIEEGTIVAILGANGAGKTSTIRTLNGVVKAKSGKILFDGENITNLEPYKLAQRGIFQSPEGRLILRGLTVEENLMVGAYSIKGQTIETVNEDSTVLKVKKSAHKVRLDTLEDVYQLFPVLKERRKQQASTLSGGEQQMLAIGRALMGKPKLLLLDEPSLGLAPLIVQEIFKAIQTIASQGTTILIVEQNAYQTLKIADYVYVLELGKVKTEGKSADLLKDDQLVKAYLGG